MALALALLSVGFFALYEAIEAPRSAAFAPVVSRGAGHAVALTFDDGPTAGITDPLLGVLERERVPATFFVVGRADDAVYAATGRHTRFLRPPFGARDAAVIDAAARHRMRVVTWTAMLGDTPLRARPRAWHVDALLRQVGDGAIVVLHDGDQGRGDDGERAREAELAPDLIAALRARGYRFVRLDALLAGGPERGASR